MPFAIVPVTAADATFSAAGAAAWAAGMTASGGTAGALVFTDTETSFAQSSGLKWNASGAAGEGLALAAGTAATAVSALSITQIWNYATAAITAILLNVTNTSSHASALLMDLQVNSTSKFKVDKAGTLTIPQGATSGYKWSHGVGITSPYSNMLFSPQYRSDVASVYSTTGSVYGFQVQNTAVIGFTSDTNGAPQTGISRLADASIALGNGTAGDYSGTLKLTSEIVAGVAIASLNASPTTGEIQSVTDANAPTLGATVASGGSAKALVWWNGANWTVIGV